MILDPSFMLNSGQRLENDFEMDLDVMSALKTRKWSAEKPRPIQSCLEKWASGEGGREKNEMNGSGRRLHMHLQHFTFQQEDMKQI